MIYDIELNYLKIGVGELKYEDKRILLTTRNSKYTFERLDIQETEGE